MDSMKVKMMLAVALLPLCPTERKALLKWKMVKKSAWRTFLKCSIIKIAQHFRRNQRSLSSRPAEEVSDDFFVIVMLLGNSHMDD